MSRVVIALPRKLGRRIFAHAEKSYPEECCGALIGCGESRKVVCDVVEMTNCERERRRDRYLIDSIELLQVEKEAAERGWDVLGFYHSHPGGSSRPSLVDQAAAWRGYSYMIVSLFEDGGPRMQSWSVAVEGGEFVEEPVVNSM